MGEFDASMYRLRGGRTLSSSEAQFRRITLFSGHNYPLHGGNSRGISKSEVEEHGLDEFGEFRSCLEHRFELLFSARFVGQNLEYLLLKPAALERRDYFRVRVKQFQLSCGEGAIARAHMVSCSLGDFDARSWFFS